MTKTLALVLALSWASSANAQPALTTLAGRGGTGGCPTFDVPGGGSAFFLDPASSPVGVAVDANGNVYVSQSTSCVFRLDADGVLRIAFPDNAPFRIGTPGASGLTDGGDAASALINNPQHLAVDKAGNIYVADVSNHRIRKVDAATWTISTVAGGGSLRPIDGIRATDASFLFSTGVAVDATGNVFVADSGAAKVFKVDTSGVLTVVAGSGAFTYNGDGIPATSAAMIPMDVAVDGQGDVFIADWSNSIVRKVTPDGLITTVAGNPFNVTGLGDGGPAAFGGILSKPRGIALDDSGNLFIADTEHHRIRMVDASGIITTVAGNGTPGNTDAQLNFPYDVAVDDLGNLFVADTANNMLRGVIVSPRTYTLTLGSAGTGSGTLTGGGSYVVGQLVRVSASASAGSTFTGWSGPNAAACAAGSVMMNADKSCTATFDTVPDTTPPALSGVPMPITATATGAAGAVVTFATPAAADPDDAAGPVTCVPPSGSTFPIGTTTVICTSTDTHGNTGSASFTVTVVPRQMLVPIVVNESIVVDDAVTVSPAVLVQIAETISVADSDAIAIPDTTPPVFSGLPASLTVEGNALGGAVVSYSLPTAIDPDDAAGPVTCAPAPQSTFALGMTIVSCRSTDTHGNSGFATFTVTVVDTTPPALTLPAPIAVDPTSTAGAIVSYAASAFDIVAGSVPVACAPASGSTFPIGSTSVACSASDGHGNSASGSFAVTVSSPAQIVSGLIAEATAEGLQQAIRLLQNALSSIGRSNVSAACGQVGAFIAQVQAQTGKTLTQAQADALLNQALDVKAALGCP